MIARQDAIKLVKEIEKLIAKYHEQRVAVDTVEIKNAINRYYAACMVLTLKHRGLTTEALSSLLSSSGVNDDDGYYTLSSIASGNRGVSLTMGYNIAQALSTPLGEMLPPISAISDEDAARAMYARDVLQLQSPNSDLISFAALRIRQEIGQRLIGVNTLADSTRLQPKTISNIQPGTCKSIRISTFWILSDELHVPVDYLLPPMPT